MGLASGVEKKGPRRSPEPPEDTSLPTGLLMLTVAVNDVDATKIVYASEYASIWLSKEPLNATDSGRPGIMTKPEVYK